MANLIQDVKPYPDRRTALVWKFYGESIQRHGKAIKIEYRAPERVSEPKHVVFEPTEDDYIMDRIMDVYEGARDVQAELSWQLDQ
jgi:hypothetical protein